MSWRYLVASILIILALFSCTPRVPDPVPAPPLSPPAYPPVNIAPTPAPPLPPSAYPPGNTTPTPATTNEPASGSAPSNLVPRITIEELLQKINSNADIMIVDTRVDVEKSFAVDHIKGAIPATLAKITAGEWLPLADKKIINKEIILYCT